MNHASRLLGIACAGFWALAAIPSPAQGFGASKIKVTLERKLPALIQLPSKTIKLTVTTADEDSTLPYDFQALLETELLKDAPDLREDENAPLQINCQITDYSHPDPIVTERMSAGSALSSVTKGAPQTSEFTRITGQLDVSFQAKTSAGVMLISDNVSATYDQEFDSSGNSTAHGVLGSFTGTFGRMKGGNRSEDINPPTPAELRAHLMQDAVMQIAEHLVDTDETVDAYLAQKSGALDEGDKAAQTGLWERALETFETAAPFSKPEEDAYRLYNIGVAYEALAYQATDEKTAMKYLDQAAINYGKAIDAKPSEKYFLEPQKRIETAIAHYKELEVQEIKARQAALAAANPPPAPAAPPAPKALTNTQIIAMVRAGMDEPTIIQAIHGADLVDFDLSVAGRHELMKDGVSLRVVTTMRTQAAKQAAARPVHKGLTNTQVIAMVKAGMDDVTVMNAIHGADAVDFDLSAAGQQQLTSGGVSARVIAAMKDRAAKNPATTGKPMASR